MSNFLTSNEINVLQENLDLFGAAPTEKTTATPAPSSRKAKPGHGAKTAQNRAARKSSRPPTQATAKPVVQTSIDMLDELPADPKRRSSPTKDQPFSSAPDTAGPKTAPDRAAPAIKALAAQPSAPPDSASPEGAIKYLAVRATSPTAAKGALESLGATVINYSMEKRDPALRNLFEALLDSGLEYRIAQQTVHWLLVEDDQPIAQHHLNSLVEIAFCSNWFEQQKTRIRGLRGADYINACADIAQRIQLKSQTRAL